MAILEAPPPEKSRGRGGRAVRTVGELLITAGLVVLLFVVYELYVTDLFSAEKQASATAGLDQDWAQGRELHSDLIDGKAFAKLYIPSFGADYHFTIQEGTDAAALEVGPGHYKGTALPGEPGNFAVAGHRVGKGSPFNDLDLLSSCDAIVVETQSDFFVYRVLPHSDELANWATGKGKQPQCAKVSTLRTDAPGGGPYGQTVGREVVSPDQGDVVAPVPHQPADALPAAQQVALLTLTTCHPQFSDKQRLIVHAVLTNQFPKTPGATYAQLLQAIGGA
ncbi:sortase (surface protein transpeptidase) [Amycolatopsis bartoniae]|uniref:Class E sortase n=1 Tax=Amycolatopsis bartoniae TaxID=941986 RepID=A0A8H9J122_9PSEU|nr:class E sortase [Amycolatopsis bartoniae]MBB2933248.1 sortase (surface protein transpeptidase) [Amycolatopsis bartoniae]TVT11765.1 class E sortase [Amycolatopsis bartoniae]GHF58154.1 class E sortase [Amycolatopsis bartoniae]